MVYILVYLDVHGVYTCISRCVWCISGVYGVYLGVYGVYTCISRCLYLYI